MWNKGFKQAIAVGELVEQMLPATVLNTKVFGFGEVKDVFKIAEWYYIEALQNCREQGITIWIPNINGGKGITFYVCFNRHGGNIGYYAGEHIFHGVSKDAYERGFLSFDSVERCANTIALQIKAMMNL
jgi:hypothetical protein